MSLNSFSSQYIYIYRGLYTFQFFSQCITVLRDTFYDVNHSLIVLINSNDIVNRKI